VNNDLPPPKGSPQRPALSPLSTLSPLLLAAAFGLALALLAQLSPAASGEPLPLRWLRKAAEHPWQSTLAAFLALSGIWPSKPPQKTQEAV